MTEREGKTNRHHNFCDSRGWQINHLSWRKKVGTLIPSKASRCGQSMKPFNRSYMNNISESCLLDRSNPDLLRTERVYIYY